MFSSQSIIGVCGAGAMGAGIAQVAAQAGHRVIVLDRDDAALTRGKESIKKGMSALVKRGKIDEQAADDIAGRIQWTLSVNDLAAAELVIEAIVENLEIKQSLFQTLEDVVGDKSVLATNTSSLPVTKISSALKRPERFLGLHFFNPAPIMKLVEVVSGIDTDLAIAAAARTLMESWNKVAVTARDVPGFIVNRVARPFYSEGWRAFEEDAADAATIDFLFRDLAGFRMGPFELGDLIGHDINTAAAKSVFDAYYGRTRFTPSLAQEQFVASGRLGRKTGRGVYDYTEGAEKAGANFLAGTTSRPGKIAVGNAAIGVRALLRSCDVGFEDPVEDGRGYDAEIDGVSIQFTEGVTASEIALATGSSAAVLDWMREPKSASAIAFAASDDRAREAARKLATALGKKAIELSDRPGLVVFRTLAQLANCAADAVRDSVADQEAIDKAMIYGVNYPFGPFAFTRETGVHNVVSALDVIADYTGDVMYNPSEQLRSMQIKQMTQRDFDE